MGLMKHEYKIIDGKRKWKRICPLCKKEVWHSCREYVYRKKYENTKCRECWSKEKTNILERYCSVCNKRTIYKSYKSYWNACKTKAKCMHCAKLGNRSRKGQKCSPEHVKKLIQARLRYRPTEETKKNQRLAAIRRIKTRPGVCHPYANYNPFACKYFDELNIKFGWNLKHAENGGEVFIKKLGYWLDSYDKEKNIVVEYDEPRHEKPSMKNRDEIRQTNIIKYLGCDFYRFSQKYNNLTKINISS